VSAFAPAPGAGRGVLAAVLGLALDAELSGRPAALPDLGHPWDAWWVAVRSGGRVRPASGSYGVCPACANLAAAAMTGRVSAHPGHVERACGCHRVWAGAMRATLPPGHLPTPPQRLTLALLKPGAPRPAIRSQLRGVLGEVHIVERDLTAGECDRLYPDAYGAGFVAQRTAYLTSGSVQVVVLAGDPAAVAHGAAVKRTVRAGLGAGALRNHLHMPDNPAEALADIALLAGWDVLQQLYRRWEGNDEQLLATRLAGYRAHLDRWAGAAGMVGAPRKHTAIEPAASRR
jgi:hypothetical protein